MLLLVAGRDGSNTRFSLLAELVHFSYDGSRNAILLVVHQCVVDEGIMCGMVQFCTICDSRLRDKVDFLVCQIGFPHFLLAANFGSKNYSHCYLCS